MRLATVLGRIISTSTLWLVVATSGVQAQDFPCRAITIVVDSGIGSGTDVVMRAFVDQVNRRGGSIPPFKVVNRIGKQTLTEFAGEPPSGCRLMAVTQSIVAERLARDTTLEWSDFTPVANLTRSPMVLAARTDLEPKPLPEILQASRGQSRKFSIGETDNALERFFLRELEDAAGVTFERRLFETMRQRYTALLAGDLDLAFFSVLAASRRGDEGELIPLAVTSSIRFPTVGSVPTLKERDVQADFNVDRGLLAPKNTPADRIAALATVLGRASAEKTLIEALRNEGTWVQFLGPDDYVRYFENQSADWRELLARTGRGGSARGGGTRAGGGG